MENKYQYTLNPLLLDDISTRTNRSIGQTNFLFNLLNGDLKKYLELESKIKDNFISYCPSTTEEIEYVLSLPMKNRWYKEDDTIIEIVKFDDKKYFLISKNDNIVYNGKCKIDIVFIKHIAQNHYSMRFKPYWYEIETDLLCLGFDPNQKFSKEELIEVIEKWNKFNNFKDLIKIY